MHEAATRYTTRQASLSAFTLLAQNSSLPITLPGSLWVLLLPVDGMQYKPVKISPSSQLTQVRLLSLHDDRHVISVRKPT
jgi:hypothetical protein